MLLRLQIRDLAIIDALSLDFGGGFTALTGETGAGKSIIVGAMNLVLGERASSEDVRTGCASAVVEALFDVKGLPRVIELLAAMNLLDEGDPGEELVIRREISSQGRGRCLANGKLITLAQLKGIGDLLVDLHGQHLHQSLLKVELHREIVDAFGGKDLKNKLDEYGGLYARHGELVSRLGRLNRDDREKERMKGLLEYQLREIEEADLAPGEEVSLEEEQCRLKHSVKLKRNTAGANDLLFEGEMESPTVADLLARCETMIATCCRLDPGLNSLAGRLRTALTELQDVAADLRTYGAGLEHDPGRLEEVEERLHLIRKLKKKYGATIEEVITEKARFEEELHNLTHSTDILEQLEAERAGIEVRLVRLAALISERRGAAGEKFSKGLRRHLKELEMPGVRFRVRLSREEGPAEPEEGDARCLLFPDGKRYRITDTGVDQVEFLISPNPGEDLKSLRRIASGGELSRIMLALKSLMRSQDLIPTLIFDEIDTGISGRTGMRIGEKMAALGAQCQVICISHLPQIAAQAPEHFVVRKIQERGRTVTRVERLDPEGRLHEIARLLGGRPDSTAARRHAKELLSQSSGA